MTAVDVDGVVHRADALRALGRRERADRMLRDALAQAPAEPRLLVALARLLAEGGRHQEALDATLAALPGAVDPLPVHLAVADASVGADRFDLLEEHALAALERSPGNPVALVHLATAVARRDRSSAGRERFRSLYREAFAATGGGTPWSTGTAVWLERTAGSDAEAGRLIDSGLERWPTDRYLLAQKAELGTTPTHRSLDILTGLLADRPDDRRTRARFDAVVLRRGRSVHAVLWTFPALLALGVVLTDGGWRVAWTVGAVVVLALAGCVGLAARQPLPAPVRADLDAPRPWRRATRIGRRWSVAWGLVGAVVLAAGGLVGAWALLLALVGWVVVRAAALLHERRAAFETDADLAVEAGGTPQGRALRGPVAQTAGRRLRSSAAWTMLMLVPLCVLALWPEPADALDDRLGRGVLGVVAAVVGLVALAEATGWRPRPRPPLAVAVGLVVGGVPAVLLAVLLVVSGSQVVDAVARSVAATGSSAPTPTDDGVHLELPGSTGGGGGRHTPVPAPGGSGPEG